MNANAELISGKEKPSLDLWLEEAESQEYAKNCGMYLFHTGVVRAVPKAIARAEQKKSGCTDEINDTAVCCRDIPQISGFKVTGMDFTFDSAKAEAAVRRAAGLPGIFHIRVWLNEGRLSVGDPLMQVLVGGDIRPRVIAALESLVEELKTVCAVEREF